MTKKSTARAKSVGDFLILTNQVIGKGSFATVYKGFRRADKKSVAIKVISRSKLTEKLLRAVQFEIDTLRKIQHQNIIRLYDFKLSQSSFYLIMECCDGGDLAAYIKKKGALGESTTRRFLKHLALGLQVLHKEQIVHRDLKPQNLLLSEESDNAILKVADFGFARAIEEKQMADTLCGSPLYMGPEVLNGNRYDASADLWSVGAILYEMVTGKPPYVATSIPHLMQLIKDKTLEYPEPGTKCGPECIDLMQRLLKPNPKERISFNEFFNHPFLQMHDSKQDVHTSFLTDNSEDSFVHLNVPRTYVPPAAKKDVETRTSPTESVTTGTANAEKPTTTESTEPGTTTTTATTNPTPIPSKPKPTTGISPFREEDHSPHRHNNGRNRSSPPDDYMHNPLSSIPAGSGEHSNPHHRSSQHPSHQNMVLSRTSSGNLPTHSTYSAFSQLSHSPPRSMYQMSIESRNLLEQNLRDVRLEDLIDPEDMSSARFCEEIFDFSSTDTDHTQLEELEKLEARAKRSWAMAEAAYLWNAQHKHVQALIVYTKSIELLYNTYLRIQQTLNINCERIMLLCMWIQHRFSEFLSRTEAIKNSIAQLKLQDSEVESGETYVYNYVLRLAKEGATQEFLSKKYSDSIKWTVMYQRCKLLLEYLYMDRSDMLNRKDKDELQQMLQVVKRALLNKA